MNTKNIYTIKLYNDYFKMSKKVFQLFTCFVFNFNFINNQRAFLKILIFF
jgi:hypothetical protein